MYIRIVNDGLLDDRLIYLLGASTKDGKNTIGRFGSGWKYTLAYLLRNGFKFKVFSGYKEIKISTQVEQIADYSYEVIQVNGKNTSITTKMGPDWRAWMAVREIYCNAIDAGNPIVERVNEIDGGFDSKTTVYIKIEGELCEVDQNWNHYFYSGDMLYYENGIGISIGGNVGFRMYKKGVLIKHFGSSGAVFSYHFDHADINELREYNGIMGKDLATVLSNLPKRHIEYFLSSLNKSHIEWKIDVHGWSVTIEGEGWQQISDEGKVKILTEGTAEALKDTYPEIKRGLDYIVVPESLFSALMVCYPDLNYLSKLGNKDGDIEIIDLDLDTRVKDCLELLHNRGYSISYPYRIMRFAGNNVLGKTYNKEILLSDKLKEKSTEEICTVLVEENEHLETGYDDLTRSFQTHFIRKYVNLLMKKK